MALSDTFLTLSVLKDWLDVTDSFDDTDLTILVDEANTEIKTQIKPFAANTLLDDTTANFTQASKAALYYAVSSWKEDHKNNQSAVFYEKRFLSKIKALKDALAAEPDENDRTDTVVISSEYKSEPLRSRERFFD